MIAIPHFQNLSAAERWAHEQDCRGGSCEGDCVGDPPRYTPLFCVWHRRESDIAWRLIQQQAGRELATRG